MNPLTQSKNATILPVLIALTLGCFGLSQQARAVCQEGCLTNDNTVLGDDALFRLTTGSSNTAIGFNALFSNTTGSFNTAIGYHVLLNNTTGFSNTAIGFEALGNNTTGTANTASGVDSLVHNTTGGNNTATGFFALYSNTTGRNNTANGLNALFFNTTGGDNTANGVSALMANTIGNFNTATGEDSLLSNTIGVRNVANGFAALESNTTGHDNTAHGQNALNRNTTGSYNIALGSRAGVNITTGNNNIDIFDRGIAGEANTIRIGTSGTQTNTFIAGISGVTVPGGVGVIIDNNGHLGTVVSSKRFKEAIKPMDKASEAILALKPVSFHYKQELDPEGIPQFGLVAEEVEKVNPDLVARDADGKAYTVRYEAVNAMLLNEFLKEHRTVQELKSTVAKQEATIAQQQKDFRATAAQQQKEIQALTTSLKEQAAQIQKVSAQLEASTRAQQMVLNNR